MAAPVNRNGFALLIALLAIVIVTALMLGTLLRTNQDTDVARAETLTQHAFAAAETALWDAVASADTRMLRMEPMGAITMSRISLGQLTTNVTVIKIDTAAIWIVSDAEIREGSEEAHHRIGLSATLAADTTDARLSPIHDHGWVELL
jgi:hypothetical protein